LLKGRYVDIPWKLYQKYVAKPALTHFFSLANFLACLIPTQKNG